MKLSRQHFEFIADDIAPLLEKPTSIEVIADKLEETNPNFNRETFTQRALKNWEAENIPAEHIATLDGLIEQIKDTPRQGLVASIMQKKAEAAQ
jgi:hypothetical protein